MVIGPATDYLFFLVLFLVSVLLFVSVRGATAWDGILVDGLGVFLFDWI